VNGGALAEHEAGCRGSSGPAVAAGVLDAVGDGAAEGAVHGVTGVERLAREHGPAAAPAVLAVGERQQPGTLLLVAPAQAALGGGEFPVGHRHLPVRRAAGCRQHPGEEPRGHEVENEHVDAEDGETEADGGDHVQRQGVASSA
jgi:hypothetical protein